LLFKQIAAGDVVVLSQADQPPFNDGAKVLARKLAPPLAVSALAVADGLVLKQTAHQFAPQFGGPKSLDRVANASF